ncbi:UDP-N-acetylmuramoyl-L-alanine--D-glutamate ligase [Litoribacillus peritrichatus]|uniref:UDP-N-acetylmuramoylalanine--D-glutamate ligase n=1 Tax=Litoribacillus peritrichatus TaxID=718191 RepID=A0ABP7LZT8_9GAMM
MSLITTDKYSVIVGLGLSGLSCARYLTRLGQRFVVMDTRNEPPLLNKLKESCPGVKVIAGELDVSILEGASSVIVGPGLDTQQAPFKALIDQGVDVVGDIELFARAVQAPVIAITGSNGKSTVTTLVGEMAEAAGLNVKVGGNIGVPALDLLTPTPVDLYVLELSSFQLETTYSLKPKAATVLNLQADHMDRYGNMVAYHKAKQRIYRHCGCSVWNKKDMLTQPLLGSDSSSVVFTTDEPDLAEFGLKQVDDQLWLMKGQKPLVSEQQLKVKGRHNLANVLAAMALGDAAGIPMEAMIEASINFTGLAHRCEWLKEINGRTFINDSKGTNVGATKAAIEGLASDSKNIVLIAGGVGKGADFGELGAALAAHCKAMVVFGEDQQEIADAVPESVNVQRANGLEHALQQAVDASEKGDVVLFSPACASFDMFRNFEHRGQVFSGLVEQLGEIND